MRSKFSWFLGGFVTAFIAIFASGGLYTMTPPNGPVDVSYKVNRLTGAVWMVKTYSKQVGPIRVLSAREAEVEDTRDIAASDIAALPSKDRSAANNR